MEHADPVQLITAVVSMLAIVTAVWAIKDFGPLLLTWAARYQRERRPRYAPTGALPSAPRAAPRETGREIVVKPRYHPLITAAWMADARSALHLLVIGHSGGGKTSLIHELALTYAEDGCRVVICDPDAAPGLWDGCEVYGYSNNFSVITTALNGIKAEVAKRRTARGEGMRRSFDPVYLVIDEYQDVARECENARPLIEDILRRGRKLDVHLIIGVQDKLVKTMGFEGQGDLRRNFTWIIEVKRASDGQRTATLTDPNDDTKTTTNSIPRLPDLDVLVESAMRSVSRVSMDTRYADNMLRSVLREEDERPRGAVQLRDVPIQPNSAVQTPEPLNRVNLADESRELSDRQFSELIQPPEMAEIARRMRSELNLGKNKIIEIMWGAKPGGTKAYRDACIWYDKVFSDENA